MQFDPVGDGKIVVGFGDIQNASDIAVIVPGMTTDLDNFPSTSELGARLTERLEQDPEFENGAAIVYLGYDAPDDIPQAVRESFGKDGAADFHKFLKQLPETAKVQLFPHSYANVLTGFTLEDGARPYAVHSFGSPGNGQDSIEPFIQDGVLFTSTINSKDRVSDSQWHGPVPPKGAIVFPPLGEDHGLSEYFDPEIWVDMMAGRRQPVTPVE